MTDETLDRCKQIRDRVAELEAEIARLTTEHNTLLGTGVVDADDMAWATGKSGAGASVLPEQVPLDPRISKALADAGWDLYARADAEPVAPFIEGVSPEGGEP